MFQGRIPDATSVPLRHENPLCPNQSDKPATNMVL